MMNYGNTIIPTMTGNFTKKTLKVVILGDSGVGKTCIMNRYSSGTFTGQYKATIGADFISKDIIIVDNYTGQNHYVTLQIWDTAGQERFQSLGVGFYRGADAAILTYDITDPISLEHLSHWKNEFLDHAVGTTNGGIYNTGLSGGVQFPFVVAGNKYDKDKKGRKIPFYRAEEWCRTNIGNMSSSSSSSSIPYNNNNTANINYNYPQQPQQQYQQQQQYQSTAAVIGQVPYHYETSAKTGWNIDEIFQQVAQMAYHYEEYRRRMQPKLFIPPSSLNNINNNVDIRYQQQNSNNNSDKCCG